MSTRPKRAAAVLAEQSIHDESKLRAELEQMGVNADDDDDDDDNDDDDDDDDTDDTDTNNNDTAHSGSSDHAVALARPVRFRTAPVRKLLRYRRLSSLRQPFRVKRRRLPLSREQTLDHAGDDNDDDDDDDPDET